LAVKGGVDGPVAGTAEPCEGVDEDAEPLGEGQGVVVAASAMAVKEVVEHRVRGQVSPESVGRLGQGKAMENPKREQIRGGLRAVPRGW
jgi:hypothetical protein